MSKTICYVKQKDGDRLRAASNPKKNGGKFTLGGKTYDGPRAENHEILEIKHWFFGRRRFAFYRDGTPTPVPLDTGAKWRTIDNPDDDANFLASVIKKALDDSKQTDLKITATMGLQGVILLVLLIQWVW